MSSKFLSASLFTTIAILSTTAHAGLKPHFSTFPETEWTLAHYRVDTNQLPFLGEALQVVNGVLAPLGAPVGAGASAAGDARAYISPTGMGINVKAGFDAHAMAGAAGASFGKRFNAYVSLNKFSLVCKLLGCSGPLWRASYYAGIESLENGQWITDFPIASGSAPAGIKYTFPGHAYLVGFPAVPELNIPALGNVHTSTMAYVVVAGDGLSIDAEGAWFRGVAAPEAWALTTWPLGVLSVDLFGNDRSDFNQHRGPSPGEQRAFVKVDAGLGIDLAQNDQGHIIWNLCGLVEGAAVLENAASLWLSNIGFPGYQFGGVSLPPLRPSAYKCAL